MEQPTLRTEPLDHTATGHRTELLYDDGTNDGILVCAAHGGGIEPGTAEQALDLAVRVTGSCWACLGYDEENAFEQWHPGASSTAISPAEHPLLETIADREFETVVSLHGLGPDSDALLVGGGTEAGTKETVADRLDEAISAPVRTVSGGAYGGVSEENFVNWLARSGGGLQLEQPQSVRANEADAVVDALETLVAAGRL